MTPTGMAASWSIVRVLHLQFGLKYHTGLKLYRPCHACKVQSFHTLKRDYYFEARASRTANAKLLFLKQQTCVLPAQGQVDRSGTNNIASADFCSSSSGSTAIEQEQYNVSPEEKKTLKKKRKEERRQERLERQKLKQEVHLTPRLKTKSKMQLQ